VPAVLLNRIYQKCQRVSLSRASASQHGSISIMATNTLISSKETGSGPKPMENAARAALSLRCGRTVTDAQWEHARTNLLEFTAILRQWSRHAEGSKEPRSKKVVTIGSRPTETMESGFDKAA
jgi:hypothetical protein